MEELEVIIDLDEILSEKHDIDVSILNEQGTRHWMTIFSQSPVPLLIADPDLHIIWANAKFAMFFGVEKNFAGVKLDKLFFDSRKYSQQLTELRYCIKSSKNSYFWQGKVEKKDEYQRSVVTNLLVLPIFKTIGEISPPIAYACIFDNISEEYKEILKITFMSLLEASRLKDNDTGNHISRVNNYSKILAVNLYGDQRYEQVNRDFIKDISFLAGMHDVGKIGTPDDILNKPGPLNNWEWEIMKEHTKNGAYILSTYPNPMAREIALYHHECWNGSGYPYGWMNEMIPLSARIVAIADFYDSHRMQRSYKEAISHDDAIRKIVEEKGKRFDPFLVDRLLMIEKEFATIYEELNDEEPDSYS
ncbi:MAG: HD domain-containing protein [Spirochaetales bacterium]|nr:HD domain-containing protein [Spirochaetales bacterium]